MLGLTQDNSIIISARITKEEYQIIKDKNIKISDYIRELIRKDLMENE